MGPSPHSGAKVRLVLRIHVYLQLPIAHVLVVLKFYDLKDVCKLRLRVGLEGI